MTRDRDLRALWPSHRFRTVISMARLTLLLRSLGNTGAVANAQRACEARRADDERVDAALRRITAPSVGARPVAA